MIKRLVSVAACFALVPAIAAAQARPAQQPRPASPPPARPAATVPAAPVAHVQPATAEQQGAIEIDVQPTSFIFRDAALYANVLAPASNTATPNRFSAGAVGRLGYHLSPRLALGAGVGYGTFADGASAIQGLAGLSYTLNPDARMSPILTAQGVYSGVSGTKSFKGMGAEVGAGLRMFIGDKTALRIDGRVGYQSFNSTPSTSAITGAAGVGLAFYMGGGPPRDTDGDGVADKRDQCPSTPAGATVDMRGCPRDSDGDRVWDGLDRCPNTPPNTPVDANGCTLDTDHDGIADSLDRCPNTPAGTPVDANGCPRDADNDGVSDNLDRCPDTPRGTPVEAAGARAGCPRDSDSDGVPDSVDRCPNTPAGTPVDANGCPRDSDGDGISDNLDRCPNTAPGTQVDANGCPVQRDADGDGVVDANDRCPNTTRGTRVDANGCPLYPLPAAGASRPLTELTFVGTAVRPALSQAARAALDKVAIAILATPNSRWEIGGYWPSRTTRLATRAGQARAQVVVTYLISKGVSAANLQAAGYPLVPGRGVRSRIEIKRIQ